MFTADGDDIGSIGVAAWTERINISGMVEFEVHSGEQGLLYDTTKRA